MPPATTYTHPAQQPVTPRAYALIAAVVLLPPWIWTALATIALRSVTAWAWVLALFGGSICCCATFSPDACLGAPPEGHADRDRVVRRKRLLGVLAGVYLASAAVLPVMLALSLGNRFAPEQWRALLCCSLFYPVIVCAAVFLFARVGFNRVCEPAPPKTYPRTAPGHRAPPATFYLPPLDDTAPPPQQDTSPRRPSVVTFAEDGPKSPQIPDIADAPSPDRNSPREA